MLILGLVGHCLLAILFCLLPLGRCTHVAYLYFSQFGSSWSKTYIIKMFSYKKMVDTLVVGDLRTLKTLQPFFLWLKRINGTASLTQADQNNM